MPVGSENVKKDPKEAGNRKKCRPLFSLELCATHDSISLMNPSELKKYRTENKLTQDQLSKKIGVNQAQVSRWESGKQPIPKWVDKLIECMEKQN